MNIIKALEILKKLELKAEELYSHYHNLYKEDKEAAGLFFGLSLEERSHADLINYQLRTIKKNKNLFADVEFDDGPLNQWISEIDAQITSGKSIPLAEAIQFGIKLESDAVECHYCTLIRTVNPELGELINKLTSADEEHHDKLKMLADNKGYLNIT
jgi:rubrerythrin